MLKRVIALDPGGTTGWAALTYDTDLEITTGYKASQEAPHWQIGHIGPENHHSKLWAFLEDADAHDLTVVCESFEFRQGKQRAGINLMPKEYIGIVNLFASERNRPVVFQTAAQGKGFVTDAKIKALDLWWPGKKHAMDAMRHLLTYMIQKRRRVELARPWKDL